LHLYCINSKERLRDKGKKGIDGGRSTIKAIKIVTDAATSAGAAYPRLQFSKLHCGKRSGEAYEERMRRSPFLFPWNRAFPSRFDPVFEVTRRYLKLQ